MRYFNRKVKPYILFFLTVLLLFSTAFGGEEPVKRIVTEKVIDRPLHPDKNFKYESLTTSPDERRLAYIKRSKNKMSLILDGQESKEYDEIFSQGFSPDSKYFVYEGCSGNKCFVVINGKEFLSHNKQDEVSVTSDGAQIVQFMRIEDNKKWMAIVDGKQGKLYDWIGRYSVSKTGEHVIYLAKSGENWFIVRNGKEGKPYSDIEGGLDIVFSPDGTRVAYVASQEGANRGYHASNKPRVFVVVDEKEGKKYRQIRKLTFSPDSKRLAYIGSMVSKGDDLDDYVVVDGQESKAYPSYDKVLVFSPDSKRFAHPACSKKNRCFVVLDGKEDKKIYDWVESITFSPDSKRLAYVAYKGKHEFLVLDGKECRKYPVFPVAKPDVPLDITGITFSPDSKRIAYKATTTRKKWHIIIDEKQSMAYDYVSSPAFSPDSKRTAYYASSRNGNVIVIDGNEKPSLWTFKDTPEDIFSPDSKHVVYNTIIGGKYYSVLGGKPGTNSYDEMISSPVFKGPDVIRYIAVRDSQVLAVEEKLIPEVK